MCKPSEFQIVFIGLAVFAAWVFGVLPFLYAAPPRLAQVFNQQQLTRISASHNSAPIEPRARTDTPIVLQVIAAPKSAEQSAQEEEDREEKKSADRWLVRWTAALFIATVGLILATGILGYFAYKQSTDMRDSIAAAKQAAEAADLSAKSALKVEQPILTARPPELASIRDSPSKHMQHETNLLSTIPDCNCLLREITLENHGRTPALLSSMRVGYTIAKERPLTPAYSHIIIFRDGEIISQERKAFTVSIDFDFQLREAQRVDLRAGARLWLWCLVSYDDFMDLRLHKEFAWQWERDADIGLGAHTYHFTALQSRSRIESRS
jgi:hypothetical protein